MDQQIAQLAARQQGNITRSQVLRLGGNGRAIHHRVRTGRLFPSAYPGVYSVGRPARTPLERASAAVLACGPGAVLSHLSAMTLWGWAKHWKTPFHVTVATDRRPKGITTHRSEGLAPKDKTRQLGIPVISPARTALDCTPLLTDKQLARALNDARLSNHLHIEALIDVLHRLPRHRGASRLKRLLISPDNPTRSSLEDEFLTFCSHHGLPRPKTNATVAGYEVDALFEAERVIVELDGYEFHSDRATFEKDRNRDADTLAAGFATVRVTQRRMAGAPASEAKRLQRILSERR
jgi:Protein of unknown function (DUF559)